MSQSNKIIATTTQLVDPSKIKELLRAIAPNFKIKNYGRLTTNLTIHNGQTEIQIGDLSTYQTNLGQITWLQTSLEENIERVLSARDMSINVAFFIPTSTDFNIINGSLYYQ